MRHCNFFVIGQRICVLFKKTSKVHEDFDPLIIHDSNYFDPRIIELNYR